MKTLQNIDEIKRFPTVTNPIKADDLHTPQAYAYTLRRAIVTDCNDRQRAELVKLLEGKESAEGVTFNNTRVNRDRLHIWQNSESRKQRAAILGEGWQYIEGLNHGTQPGDVICCVDGTRGRVTKSDPESCCIEFETADGRRLSVAGYFRKEHTRLMFANGTKDNHAQGICINHKDGAKHLEEHRRLFHKSSKREVVAEGPDFITVRYLDYNSAYDNGVRTYYLEPAA